MEVFQCIILNFGFCIILSHKWFYSGAVLSIGIHDSWRQRQRLLFFCFYRCQCFDNRNNRWTYATGWNKMSIISLFSVEHLGDVCGGWAHTHSLSFSPLRVCVCLLPLSVRVSSRVSLTKIPLYHVQHGRFGLRTKTSMLTGSRCVVIKTEVCMCDLSHLGTFVCVFMKPKLFFNSKSSFYSFIRP